MKKTLFVLAPPDNLSAADNAVTSEGDGVSKVEVSLPGLLPIMPYIESDQLLHSNSARVVLGAQTLKLPANSRFNMFNLVGDPDISGKMLRNIQALETKVHPLRCFNRPINVFKTSRERLPDTLANIPGCVVPRVVPADPANFEELISACRSFDRWPMIVRARGYHGGKNMVRATSEADLEPLREAAWAYEGIYMVDYIEFKGTDGLYQKNRAIMINGTPYLRHAVFSDQWAIHAGSRKTVMDADKSLRVREEKFLANFSDKGFKKYARIFKKIQQRIDLDVFGIDFAIVDDQIVVFEANACMNFLSQQRGNTDYNYLAPYIQSLEQALKKMLVRA